MSDIEKENRIPIIKLFWLSKNIENAWGMSPDDELAEFAMYYRFYPHFLSDRFRAEYEYLKKNIFSAAQPPGMAMPACAVPSLFVHSPQR